MLSARVELAANSSALRDTASAAEKSLRVLFLTRYGRLGASSRVRTLHYSEIFRENGLQMEISALADDAMLSDFYNRRKRSPVAYAAAMLNRVRILKRASRYHLIWIEKELFPYLPAIAERRLHRRGIPYIADYDDAVFHNYDQHKNAVIRRMLRHKIAQVMRCSACVCAGNSYLADYARAAGARRVEYIPTVVNTNRYFPTSQVRSGDLRIGWIGTPATTQYLNILKDVISVLPTNCGIRFVLIGASKVDLPDVPVEFCSWSESTEVEQIQGLDVGVMPLFDGCHERGKCGYKLIQYMACGLPVVASPVGVNRDIVRHGVNGYLATTPQEWAEALIKLKNDSVLRQTMGAAGRRRVEKEFSINVIGPRLVEIFRDVARTTTSSLSGQRETNLSRKTYEPPVHLKG